jgi:hypothetical protein
MKWGRLHCKIVRSKTQIRFLVAMLLGMTASA